MIWRLRCLIRNLYHDTRTFVLHAWLSIVHVWHCDGYYCGRLAYPWRSDGDRAFEAGWELGLECGAKHFATGKNHHRPSWPQLRRDGW